MPTQIAPDIPGCSSPRAFWRLFCGWWIPSTVEVVAEASAVLSFWPCFQTSSALLAQPEVQVWDGLVVCVGLGEWVGRSGKHLSNESRGPRDIGFFFFFKERNFCFMPFILSVYPELSKGSTPPGVPLAGDLCKEISGRGEVKIGYFLNKVSSPSISPTFSSS